MIRNYTVISIIYFLLSFATTTIAADTKRIEDNLNSGIIYGKNHSFTLKAPNGWILDNQSGMPNGLHAVFYPRGSSWESGSAVMYANTADKEVKGNETIVKVIEYDISQFKQKSPKLNVKNAEPLLTQENKKAIVKHFFGDRFNNYEAIAYIDERKVVVFIVLSSRTKKDFEKSLPAFKELVNSYFFITETVKENN